MSSYKVKKSPPRRNLDLLHLDSTVHAEEEKQQANKCEQVLNSLSDICIQVF